MINFSNKKIIITGATGGIGNELVKKFVSLKGEVLATGTNEEKLEKEKKIVIQERKQSYENSPYGDSEEFMQSLVFPNPHPYNWQTIGIEKDINNAKLSETIDFHKKYYIPDNASLCLSGNFNVDKATKWITKYFGDIYSPEKPEFKSQQYSSLKKTQNHCLFHDH